jgi:NADPH-dependent FMN reductase
MAKEISMNNYKIALVIGSLRKESFNRKLANALVKLAPTEFSFNELQIGNLPLYNQDDDENQADSVSSLPPTRVPGLGEFGEVRLETGWGDHLQEPSRTGAGVPERVI